MDDLKALLHAGLRSQRAALRLKLGGLPEAELRMPRTPTGTNLLGLLKHCASIEASYFGEVFGRPAPFPMPWEAPGVTDDDNLDMFAGSDESLDDVLTFCQACFDHADGVIGELALEATGVVPWWPQDRREVTLGQVILHVSLDEARHAGQADILREGIDGAVGLRSVGNNIPDWEAQRWADHVAQLTQIAHSRR